MTQPIATIQTGDNHSIALFPGKIVLRRKGALNTLIHGFDGAKTIYTKHISAMQVSAPGTFTAGFLQFTLSGGNESTGGKFQAAGDENTILFQSKDIEDINAICSLIEDQILKIS
ncbi:hypothetical protein OAE29_05705 [Octadecabacter sp.]|nr:hypothetical protein [Octadecabacter sp.]